MPPLYRAIMLPSNRYIGIVIAKHQCRTLALLAQKGGSGKTTLALHLAVIAQDAGLRTLLIDCDPQRSAAGWWRAREAETPELVETAPDQLRAVVDAARADGVALVIVDTRPSVERGHRRGCEVGRLFVDPYPPLYLGSSCNWRDRRRRESTQPPGCNHPECMSRWTWSR